jgi:hypothetical protein
VARARRPRRGDTSRIQLTHSLKPPDFHTLAPIQWVTEFKVCFSQIQLVPLHHGDEGVTSALASRVLHFVWLITVGSVGVSGWVFAWYQQRKFASVLDPALHAKCCGVCMEAPKTIVLVPCGHQLCQACAPKVDKCPQCRVTIKERVVVHE